MNILLCASKTPDTTTKIIFSADKKSIDAAGVQFILNPYDDHALARAMDLKEKFNGKLTVIHVGDGSVEPILRRCLAIGADEAVRVDADASDAVSVASQIASAIKGENFDLILTGRESIDFNGSQVGDMLGELLGIPSVSFVSELEIDGNTKTLRRFIDGGEERLSVDGPLIISAAKELAEPRIPNMRGIMQSRTKPIKVIESNGSKPAVELVELTSPDKKSSCVFIEVADAANLIDILHTKEKLI